MTGIQELSVLAAGLVEREVVAPETAAAEGFDPVATALSALDMAEAGMGALADELRDVKRSLAAQKGAATKARAALSAAMPARPRKLGPVKDQLPAGDLLELIDAAETVELAFSDGRGEIRGLAPRQVEGGINAWQASRGRLRLQVPELVILGPEPDKPAYVLAGYALVLDGEQVAWAAREPVTIAPGTRFEFRDDVIFG